MQAGAKATREIFPDALVALHFANPEKADSYDTYASKMDYYKVYSVIGNRLGNPADFVYVFAGNATVDNMREHVV